MSDCFCMNSMIWLYCNLMSYVCMAFDSQMEYKCTDFNGVGVNWNEKTWDKSIDSAVRCSQHYKVRFKSRQLINIFLCHKKECFSVLVCKNLYNTSQQVLKKNILKLPITTLPSKFILNSVNDRNQFGHIDIFSQQAC